VNESLGGNTHFGWFTLRAITFVSIVGVAVWPSLQSSAREPVIDGAQLHASVDTFFTTTVRAGATDTIGWATQSLVRARDGGRATWAQVYRWHGRDGSSSTDSLVMDASSLHPFHETRATSAGDVTVKYAGARVRASVTPVHGPTRSEDTSYAMPVFSSASLDALARAIPRKLHYSAQLELYYPFPAPYGVRSAHLVVTGTETVPSRDQHSIECWVVVAELPDGTTKFWVARGTGAIVQFASGEGDSQFFFLRPGAPAT
jgi:hypothetical protein